MKTPEWLDESLAAYRPVRLTPEGPAFFPNRDFYEACPHIKAAVKIAGWKSLTPDDRLRAVWKYVVENIEYRFDPDQGKGENWQFPCETLVEGKGDCEDGTSLFVAFCRAAGVPADSVFNACGLSPWGPHSFAIAKGSDGAWRVYESTLNFTTEEIPKLEGGDYDVSFGVANWKFAGQVKPEAAKMRAGSSGQVQGKTLIQI